MPPTKTIYQKYPTGLKIQFAQNGLTKSQLKNIPRSTRQSWKNYNIEKLWAPADVTIYDHENITLINALAEVQKLRKTIRAMAGLLIIYRKFLSQFSIERNNVASIAGSVASCLAYLQNNIPKNDLWKFMPFSNHQWSAWKTKKLCKVSLLQLCRRKYTHQLIAGEVEMIKESCSNIIYQHWPLISIYYSLLGRRNCTAAGVHFINIAGCYK
ncbi:MAG: hypothetical protein ABIN01_18420 [Ferruginibacter sp.]